MGKLVQEEGMTNIQICPSLMITKGQLPQSVFEEKAFEYKRKCLEEKNEIKRGKIMELAIEIIHLSSPDERTY